MAHKTDHIIDWLELAVPANEKLLLKSGAIVSMSLGLAITDSAGGQSFKGFKRKLLGGGSLELSEIENTGGEDARVCLASSMPGEIRCFSIENKGLIIQSGAFLACTEQISMDMNWQDAEMFFSGERLRMIPCHGSGKLWLAAFGALKKMEAKDGIILEASSIVAFDEGLDYRLVFIPDSRDEPFSQDGLEAEFRGEGTIWVQTQTAPPIVSLVNPHRPK